MAAVSRSDELKGAQFVEVDLRGARFAESDLSGVVMRGVELRRADIDAPWLSEADVSVDGEWSFAQTLRHLVMATDIWLGRAILEEGWEHHRFAVRDLETIQARSGG